MRILRLCDVNEGLKFISANVDNIDLILPLGFLENVLKEKKLKSVEEQLFGKSAKKPFYEESQERMLVFIFEIVVCKYGHPVDNHLDFFVKEEFFILERLLGISLRITKLLLFFDKLLLDSFFLLEISKKVGHGGIARVEVWGIPARIS